MDRLKNIYSNYKKIILTSSAILSILLISSFIFMGINNKYEAKDYNVVASVEEKEAKSEINENKISTETIKVDVKGYVENPGVYELLDGARVIDAIKAAGGLKEESYTRYINLSKKLNDENVIIVNSKEEIEVIKKGETKEVYCESINSTCIEKEDIITNEIKSSLSTTAKDNTPNKDESNVNTLVNINTATKEELSKLSGIGESKAVKIIEYRNEYGRFNSIEDIMKVKGIGETIYAKIKENITV